MEIWHPETLSFHMLFGEMTITLDGVSCLLHLPIKGDFYYHLTRINEEGVFTFIVELFGVVVEKDTLNTLTCMDTYYKLDCVDLCACRYYQGDQRW